MPELAIAAPDGAHFEFEEVKTAKGSESLGHVPLLVWDKLDAATSHYGEEGIRDVMDGTSLRVSFQNIARRYKIAGKTDDEIASAMIAFKPGKRQGGVSTPVSRASRAAKAAAEKVGDEGDLVTTLLEKIAKGELSADDLKSLIA